MFFFSHSILDGNLFILQRSSSTNNIFEDLPALSAPSKSDLRDELNRYLSTDPEHVTNAISWWYEKHFVYPLIDHVSVNLCSARHKKKKEKRRDGGKGIKGKHYKKR